MRASRSRGKRPALCYGKIRYRDRKSAKAAMAAFKSILAENPDAAVPRRAYRCHRCNGGWHLTSQTVVEYATANAEHAAEAFAETYLKKRQSEGRALRQRRQRELDRERGGRRRNRDADDDPSPVHRTLVGV